MPFHTPSHGLTRGLSPSLINTNGNPKTDLLISVQDKIVDPGNEDDWQIIDKRVNEFEIEEGLDENYNLQLDIIKSLVNTVKDNSVKIDLRFDLENSVNLFLNNDIDVIDIKYQLAIAMNGEEQLYCFSAMIIYH